MKTSACKGCGKPIVWAYIVKNGVRTGKKVPMDPKPVVYRLRPNTEGGHVLDSKEYEAEAVLQAEGMVTHFATCSQADKFSGRNR